MCGRNNGLKTIAIIFNNVFQLKHRISKHLRTEKMNRSRNDPSWRVDFENIGPHLGAELKQELSQKENCISPLVREKLCVRFYEILRLIQLNINYMCDTGVFGCECSMICMWLRWKDEKINGQRVFNSLWPDRTWFATICHLNLPVDLSYLRSQNAFDSVPRKKKEICIFHFIFHFATKTHA